MIAAGGFAAGAGMSLNAPASLAISAALADENERSLTPETAADLAAGISAAMGQGGAAAVVEEQLKRNESRKSSGFFSSLFGKSKKGASGGGDREDQSSPPPGKEFPKRGSEGSEDLQKRGSQELSPAEMPETRRKSFFGLGRSGSSSSKRGADLAAAEPAADPSDPDWAVWSAHDQDRSGTVSTQELGGLFSSAGLELSAAQLAALLASADHDGSGRLSFKEFKALLLRCRADGATNVVHGAGGDADWVAYSRFDRDGVGSVSSTDFAALFDTAGVKLNAAQIGVIAASSEADGGGRRLAFASFKALLAKCRAEGVATAVASMSSSPTPAAAAPEAKRDWVRSKLDAESAVVAGAGAAGARGGSAELEPACRMPPPAPAGGVAGVAAAGAAAAEGAPQQLPLKRKVRKGKPAAANGVSPTGTSPRSATRSLSSVSPPPLVEGGSGGAGDARSAPVPLKPKTKTKAPLLSSTGATTPTGGSGAAGGGQKLVRQGSGKIPIRAAEANSPTTADAVPKRRKKPKDKAGGGGVTRERTI
jgi:Ca2+-binding EF-hand superfamily protein